MVLGLGIYKFFKSCIKFWRTSLLIKICIIIKVVKYYFKICNFFLIFIIKLFNVIFEDIYFNDNVWVIIILLKVYQKYKSTLNV